ncbi:MAG: hypothetical protein AAF989_00795 [Planctomycetota bacterium]
MTDVEKTGSIEDALHQLDAISSTLSRVTRFDGFRALPIGLGGVLGLVAAVTQSQWLPWLGGTDVAFVGGWMATAVTCLTIVMADITWRYVSDPSARKRRLSLQVLARLMPGLLIGAAFPVVLLLQHPNSVWMLPSLWSLVLGLAIFAAADLLPTSLSKIGIWYVAAGFVALIWLPDVSFRDPRLMGIVFGGGQLWTACLLVTTDSSPSDESGSTS